MSPTSCGSSNLSAGAKEFVAGATADARGRRNRASPSAAGCPAPQSGSRSSSRLKIDLLIAVTVGRDRIKDIGALLDVGAAVVHHAVAENILFDPAVFVAEDAAERLGKAHDAVFEDLCHVVVELEIVGTYVHGEDRPAGRQRKRIVFAFDEFEIGNGM